MLRSEGLCLRSGENPRGSKFSEIFRAAAARIFSKTRVAARICLHRISLLALREAYGGSLLALREAYGCMR